MQVIKKKHIYEAINLLQTLGTKASRFALLALKQVIRHSK